jgi:CDP-diacylglycerol---serine O-phosphatidyltransferase
MKSIIPNAVTALNLVFGMFAIMNTIHGAYTVAAFCVVAAMVADAADGRTARFFGVSSDFGKELDSLCDLVSFGAAPAFLAYAYYLQEFDLIGQLVAVFFAVCGALRLARFNVNTDIVKGHFMGLPIPAAGCAVVTFIMMGIKPAGYTFPLFVAVFGYLMVSTIKYPDFKGKGEKIHPIPVLLSLASGCFIFITNHHALLFAVIFTYAIFGILNTIFSRFGYKSEVL